MYKSLFINTLALIFSFCPLHAVDNQQEISNLDNQIEMLKDEQLRHRARAVQDKNNADRWQFDGSRFDEARQAYESEEMHLRKIQELQKQIDALEVKKANLLKDGKSG